jgi:chemotaxis protein MotB
MITLLLGLFIVLFAMSTIDAKQFDNVKRSLAQTFHGSVMDGSDGVLPGSNGVMDPTAPSQAMTDSAVTLDEATRTNREYQKETQVLQQIAQRLGASDEVQVARTEVGIQISIAGDALFAPGSYQLSQPGLKTELARIQNELKRFGKPIRIEGHTDGQPCDCQFGNLGLSAMRASSVESYFVGLGFPDGLVHGAFYGDRNPKVKPKHPHDSVAANRRIEIVVLDPSYVEPAAAGPHADMATPGGTALPVPRTPRGSAPSPEAIVDSHIADEVGSDALVGEIVSTGQAIG